VQVTAKSPKPRCGLAQSGFIDATSKAIKRSPRAFFVDNKDWGHVKCAPATPRHMLLTGKNSIRPEHFYVKDIAAWIPHLLIPNCVSTCPKCRQKSGVDAEHFCFVENPKVLCGVHTHRYLDAVHYTCGDCKGDFLAWRPDCLTLDSKEIAGILNFRMSVNMAFLPLNHVANKQLRNCLFTTWFSGKKAMLTKGASFGFN